MRLRLAAACAAALLAAACQTPSASGPRLGAPMDADPPYFREFLPAGEAAPRSAVLIVPACEAPLISSRAQLYVRYAEFLRDEGFAVAILAWPGSGAGEPACNALEPSAISVLIAAALYKLQVMRQVDSDRLHLVGWGHGGLAVLDFIASEKRHRGLVSAVAVYPACPAPAPWRSEVTLLLALAELDATNPPAACRAWAEKSEGPGPVAITRYTGVGHGFDVAEAGDPAFDEWRTGTPLAYDNPTAWQFRADLLKFLRLNIDAGS